MTQTPFSGSQGPGRPRGTSGGATQGVGDQAQDKVGQVVGQAQDTVAPVIDQAQQTAGQVTDQAKQQATSQLESQKSRAVDSLVTVAQALRQTSQHLQEQKQGPVAGYVDQLAEQAEKLTNYLRGKDVGELIDDTEQLARRQPGLFAASAVALGFLGGRFLMTSGQRAASRRRGLPGPHGAPGAYGSGAYGVGGGQARTAQAYPYGRAGSAGSAGASPVATAAEDVPGGTRVGGAPGTPATSTSSRDDPHQRLGPGAQGV